MVNNTIKKIVARAWENRAYEGYRSKLKLYGNYKEIYSWPAFEFLKQHIELFKPLKKRINTEWYRYFTLVRQAENPAYLPEDIWHICMEPVLNHRSFAKAFNDKNYFHLHAYKSLLPFAYFHVIDGVFYNSYFQPVSFEKALEMIPSNAPVVLKKSLDTGGGKGVSFYSSKELIKDANAIIAIHGGNFVAQEHVKQHDWFARFNHTSVNTIRVVTYRSVADEKVYVIQALLRVGKKGMLVDNQSSGGVAVGIDKNGFLNSWGCDKLSNRFDSINDIQLSSVGQIPDFELLKSTCIEIAKTRFHERVLVFDTWRDEQNNMRLLEINNINIGIEDLQKNNGPMFGDFTNEVIDYCAKNKRTYCFDFEA